VRSAGVMGTAEIRRGGEAPGRSLETIREGLAVCCDLGRYPWVVLNAAAFLEMAQADSGLYRARWGFSNIGIC
jgi:hypothetical protein